MGIDGIEHLTGNVCEEWWTNPRREESGADIVDHNHVCALPLNHPRPCECSCGAVRPLEDHD